MKKLIFLLVIVGVLFAGYSIYSSPSGQDTVEKAKVVKMGYEIINEKDPQKVLEVVEKNENLINSLVDKGLVTSNQVNEGKQLLEDMAQRGEQVDKQALADKYIKDKISSEEYKLIVPIITKEELTLEDLNSLRNILEK